MPAPLRDPGMSGGKTHTALETVDTAGKARHPQIFTTRPPPGCHAGSHAAPEDRAQRSQTCVPEAGKGPAQEATLPADLKDV